MPISLTRAATASLALAIAFSLSACTAANPLVAKAQKQHEAKVAAIPHCAHKLGTISVIEPEGGMFDREALERHLAAQLPRYKHPRRIWLCLNMPMTQSGKVAAGTLRQWIADGNDALELID